MKVIKITKYVAFISFFYYLAFSMSGTQVTESMNTAIFHFASQVFFWSPNMTV